MRRLTLVVTLFLSSIATADDWGNIKGRIVFKGDIPAVELIHKANSPTVKNKETCAAKDLYKEDLVINKENKGVANCIVFAYKPKKKFDDSTDVPKRVYFDQKNCKFKPHVMIVRAGQTVEVLNSDPIAHNTHTYPLKNEQKNLTIVANTVKKGTGPLFPTTRAEIVPHEVKCDFHSYMLAYWFVVDHPYAAVTDKDGKFEIKNLPLGEHKFRIWHERPGYINRSYMVTVKKTGDNVLEPVVVDIEKLTD